MEICVTLNITAAFFGKYYYSNYIVGGAKYITCLFDRHGSGQVKNQQCNLDRDGSKWDTILCCT